MSKPKILLSAEFSLLSTGFSVMNYEILKNLHEKGYEVAELASYISADDPRINEVPWKVYPVIPSKSNPQALAEYNHKSGGDAQFGSLVFDETVLDFQPDIVFSYRDYWHDQYIVRAKTRHLFNYIWSTCIDSEPPQKQWLADYSCVDLLSSYTNWGLGVLKNHGGSSLNIASINTMPGIDTDMFCPKDKKELRKKYKLDADANIILSVMRNQPRKLIPDLIRTFMANLDKMYKNGEKELADKTYLYLHSGIPDVGYDLEAEILKHKACNRVLTTYYCPDTKKIFTSFFRGELTYSPFTGNLRAHPCNTFSGANREQLSDIFAMSDLFIQYSVAGALEIPIIEAKSCGIPVICVEYAGPYELGKQPGTFRTIPVIGYKQEGIKETQQLRCLPDNNKLLEAIGDYLHLDEKKKMRLSKEARKFAVANHDTKTCAEKWETLFSQMPQLESSRWTREPQLIGLNKEEIPWNAPNPIFVRWCVQNLIPDKHPAKTFVSEKNFVKMLTVGYNPTTGQGIDKEGILREICQIAYSYNQFEEYRYDRFKKNTVRSQTPVKIKNELDLVSL